MYININNTYLARMDFCAIVDEKTAKIDLSKVTEQWNRSLKVLHSKLRQQDFFSISASAPGTIHIHCYLLILFSTFITSRYWQTSSLYFTTHKNSSPVFKFFPRIFKTGNYEWNKHLLSRFMSLNCKYKTGYESLEKSLNISLMM